VPAPSVVHGALQGEDRQANSRGVLVLPADLGACCSVQRLLEAQGLFRAPGFRVEKGLGGGFGACSAEGGE